MQETERHYSMKYQYTICYFPSRNEWGYVASVNGRGDAFVQFINHWKDTDDDAPPQAYDTLSVIEVPYKAPPGGWLVYPISDITKRIRRDPQEVGVVLFSRMMKRTFRCGISSRHNYQVYTGDPIRVMGDRMTKSTVIRMLAALNRNETVSGPSPYHAAVSRNFSILRHQVYWRDLQVGEIAFEKGQLNCFLQEAVQQEFQDQVDLEECTKRFAWDVTKHRILDIRDKEEELL